MKAVDTLRFHLSVGARLFTPSVSPSARQLPRQGAFGVCFTSSHIKPALKGEVSMSVSELTEGLKKKVASLGIVNPSVKPSVCQLPVRGAFMPQASHEV